MWSVDQLPRQSLGFLQNTVQQPRLKHSQPNPESDMSTESVGECPNVTGPDTNIVGHIAYTFNAFAKSADFSQAPKPDASNSNDNEGADNSPVRNVFQHLQRAAENIQLKDERLALA